MDDEAASLMRSQLELYQQFVDQNLAADRAIVGGQVSTYLSEQAKSAREAIGLNGRDPEPADASPAA